MPNDVCDQSRRTHAGTVFLGGLSGEDGGGCGTVDEGGGEEDRRRGRLLDGLAKDDPERVVLRVSTFGMAADGVVSKVSRLSRLSRSRSRSRTMVDTMDTMDEWLL